MKKFVNNRTVTISDLQQSGLYNQQLLKDLMIGDFEKLADLSIETRANIDYMEPLLYAVKNSELDTFQVYKYYAENLQSDVKLAAEIIITEPNLIEGTPISGNRQFIMEHATTNPEIIKYMSPQLKVDNQLIKELSSQNDTEVLKKIAENCVIATVILNNPELSNNKNFMSTAIKKDATILEYASNELKNDYTFMKEICSNNKEAINYISEHTESFGKEGLTAAKEVLVEGTTSKAISGFEAELEVVNIKIEEQSEQIEEQDLKKLKRRKNQLEKHRDFIEKIKEGKVNRERAIRLINTLCKNLDEDYKKELMQYIKMDDALIEKQKETSMEDELAKEKTEDIVPKIGIQDVEGKTAGVQLGAVNKEAILTKEAIKEGEKNYDESNNERT